MKINQIYPCIDSGKMVKQPMHGRYSQTWPDNPTAQVAGPDNPTAPVAVSHTRASAANSTCCFYDRNDG
jgi:hypothetical protein